jgi:type VI secretion system FHA domain protein
VPIPTGLRGLAFMPLILTLTPTRGGGSRETRTLNEGSLSIGRGPGNDWVLADPDRLLSKTHCIISIEGSRYALTDVSTNGVYVNGAKDPTRRDSRTLLADGDRLRLGDYTVTVAEVEIAPAARQGDRPAARQGDIPVARGGDPFAAPAGASSGDDPFGGGADDPFGEPGTLFRHPIGKSVPVFRPADPFDETGGDPLRAQDADDDLFRGVTPSQHWQGPSQPDNADAPKQAFLAPKPIPPANLNDFDFDALLGDEPIGAPPPARITTPPAAPAAEPADVLGFLDDEDPPHRPLLSSPPPQGAAPASVRPPERAVPPEAPGAAAFAAAPSDQDTASALLAAFLKGAGVPDLKMPRQDPQATMQAAGEVFRALVEGLREVLMSRAAIKNELRVEQTMLRSRDNNALKFSVTPEEAVAALLIPDRAGYKPPLDATREAFRDIQSHEMAVMAGVQTALVGLLKRFDPASLEARLQPGRLDSILPAARRARIWELFCATYKDIALEAEDDFQSVFGREFAKAYEAQMKKL